jgi:hypothetical protein
MAETASEKCGIFLEMLPVNSHSSAAVTAVTARRTESALDGAEVHQT